MEKIFKGVGTALLTPFDENGEIDFPCLKKFISWQIESKINFLVPCGTTGETVTFSDEEYCQVIKTTVSVAKGKLKVLAGAGSNSTSNTIKFCNLAEKNGADGLLVVTPYYNKPTQTGLKLHFEAVAKEVSIPIILYNVPGRTGVNLLPETVLELAQNPKITGIKEASGKLEQAMEIIKNMPENFVLLSGDDVLTLPVIACGGEGVISVASNVIPKEFSELVRLALDGNFHEAQKIHFRFLNLMNLNFIESNPIPAKCFLSLLGKMPENYRLPLTKISEKNKLILEKELKTLSLK
ncbi:4-hydroxy-tetrahydrodipicolinate synthase [bacterium]|nr:4-hydroxy-tetrahydrodipicolinate synthase [bacterium]